DVGTFGSGDDFDATYLPSGASYATVVNGTVNSGSILDSSPDLDVGWTTEIFIPWLHLQGSAPSHGDLIGMNFDLIFDDSGETRDLTDHRSLNDRFTSPVFVDDHLLGVHSSYSATLAGVHGPSNYAHVMFVESGAGQPVAITDLVAESVTGYGAIVGFTAPAGSANGGHVSSYEMRLSSSPITTDLEWANATRVAQQYVPRLAGLHESLRLVGLQPGETWHVSVRGVDGAGNLGALGTSTSFTTSASDTSGGMRLVPSPMGRVLVHEDGTPFTAVGDHLGLSWYFTRQLFLGDIWDNANSQFLDFSDPANQIEGTVTSYFDTLQAHGVNTMRVYLELQNTHTTGNASVPNGTYWLEHGPGNYNDDMRMFIENVLNLADQRGMYVIFSPFDTFSYDEAFGVEGPWSSALGGPLTDINDFFQTPATLQIATDRMDQLVTWVEASGKAHRVLGWEAPSEWDSYEWTLNAEGDGFGGREPEFVTRANWMIGFASHMRQAHPSHLVLNSTIAQDPRGPLARVVFLDRTFSALTPHLYTNANEEPINNPDTHRHVRAAVEQGLLSAYWMTMSAHRLPLLDGEWGMTRSDWEFELPQYSDEVYDVNVVSSGGLEFRRAEDEGNFRSLLYAGLASGQFGTPLRIAADELGYIVDTSGPVTIYQGFILTDAMRDTQLAIRTMLDSTALAFTNASPDPLAGRLSSVNTSGDTLHLFGSADALQGMVYVLQDENVRTGTVSGTTLSIDGLERAAMYDVEIWDPAGTLVTTLTDLVVSGGTLQVALPDFDRDVLVRFRGQAANGGDLFVQIFQDQVDADGFVNGDAIVDTLRSYEENVSYGQGYWGAENNWFMDSIGDIYALWHGGDVHLIDGGEHRWILTNLTAAAGLSGQTQFEPGSISGIVTGWNAFNINGIVNGELAALWWSPASSAGEYVDTDGSVQQGLGLGINGNGWQLSNISDVMTDLRTDAIVIHSTLQPLTISQGNGRTSFDPRDDATIQNNGMSVVVIDANLAVYLASFTPLQAAIPGAKPEYNSQWVFEPIADVPSLDLLGITDIDPFVSVWLSMLP
ncbi:MAG: fibronectin type III domain-containing protein, partial [Phycisphaerales bacterium]|nr:fibronectin type III domain-containing protein [Phycisphaerales bacterium]